MLKISKYFIPYIAILIIIGYRGQIFLSLVFVIIHEFVHYFTARLYGYRGFDIEILPFGARVKLNEIEDAEPKEDFTISISGPISNLILAVIFYIFGNKDCYVANISLFFFNLLPALPLDGGRIARDLICTKTFYKKSNRIVVNMSLTIGAFFMFYFFYLFYSNRVNFSIGLIAFLIVFFSLKEKERIAYVIMGDIIKKRRKFIKKGYMENRNVSVYFKKDLLYGLSLVDKNKYNIFTVMDDSMNVIDVIYEEDIIEGLKKYGNITFEEVINYKLRR